MFGDRELRVFKIVYIASFSEADTCTTQDNELYLSVLEDREQAVHESAGMELEWSSFPGRSVRTRKYSQLISPPPVSST